MKRFNHTAAAGGASSRGQRPQPASPWPYLGRACWSLVRFLFMLCMTFVILYPLIYMLSVAVRDAADVYDMSVVWIPKHFSLEGFRILFTELNFTGLLLNSALITLGCTVLQVFICSMTGYGFARFRFRGKGLLFVVVLLSIIVPPQMVNMPNYLLFHDFDIFGIWQAVTGHGTGLNLLDKMGSLLLLAAVGQGIRAGLFIFIFRQYYKGVPAELEQAAMIDGCGYASTYFRIMLPNAGGPLRICVLFSLVWYWCDYYTLSTYLVNTRTVSVVLGNLRDSLQAVVSLEAIDPYKIVTVEQAACVLSVLPLLLLFLLVQRTFARSIETTGLVG